MKKDLFETLGKAFETLGKATKPKKPPQWKRILVWLQAGHSITGLEAQRMFNCEALTQRIAQLRTKKGYNKEESPDCYIPNPAELIKTSTGKWIAKYKLIQK